MMQTPPQSRAVERRFGFVGRPSAATRELFGCIDKLGRSRCAVLVTGETGTGKELVARALHAAGDPTRPFVTVDCSALPESLMESELFGHVRGAFTGASQGRDGLLAAADGGTLFLDEVGELPLSLQAKLLRALQEKEYRPVGAVQTRRADFRVLAATNRDLRAEVERGRFRHDLYYRLNVVHLQLSPLRERPEDIDILAEHFLAKHGDDHRLTLGALNALRAHSWPGNVRELEHAIQAMTALSDGPVLDEGLLPAHILACPVLAGQEPAEQAQAGPPSPCEAVTEAAGDWIGSSLGPCSEGAHAEPFEEARLRHLGEVLPLAEVERRAILAALEVTQGDRGATARLLEIGRTTLYRKLLEYGYTERLLEVG